MAHTQYMKEIKFKESRATSRMGYLPIEGGGLKTGMTMTTTVSL